MPLHWADDEQMDGTDDILIFNYMPIDDKFYDPEMYEPIQNKTT